MRGGAALVRDIGHLGQPDLLRQEERRELLRTVLGRSSRN